jgi:hypothetical protein
VTRWWRAGWSPAWRRSFRTSTTPAPPSAGSCRAGGIASPRATAGPPTRWCAALALLVTFATAGWTSGQLLGLTVLAGALSHVVADGLTVAGVPLWWPWRRRRVVFLGALAFPTHSWREHVVVLGVLAGVGYWVTGS